MKILIIGDHDASFVADMMIKRSFPDYETLVLNNGLKAVVTAKDWGPDIIFLMNILYMPGFNGLELCAKLRSVPEMTGVKIVISSAKRAEVDSLLVGATAFLPKLFDHNDVRSLLIALRD